MGKIGIMGGTFNPIHNGHLMLAQAAFQQFQLDKILVIPNRLPAYKDTDELLDSNHRSQMVRLAISQYPYMEFSDMELRRSGATYTVDTLNELHEKYPEQEFYFILGGDSLIHFTEWRRYDEILKLAVILCAKREDADLPELCKARNKLTEQVTEARIEWLDTPMMDISSTEIRESVHNDDAIAKWLPDSVFHYIQEHQLYIS